MHYSAGSEHLPYKQRVTGSNPVVPTTSKALWIEVYKAFLFERLLNKMMFLKIIKTQKAELINQIDLNLFDKGIYFINVMENNQSVYRSSIIKE